MDDLDKLCIASINRLNVEKELLKAQYISQEIPISGRDFIQRMSEIDSKIMRYSKLKK